MLLKNINIIVFFHCHIFWKKIQTSRPRFSLKASPSINMQGCFMVLTINFGSYCDALLARRTTFGNFLISIEVLSSLNITFPNSAGLCRYFLQKLSLFFIAAVNMGFLAARRHFRRRSFKSRWQIVLVETVLVFSFNGSYRQI